jgi:putative transposase
MPRMASVLPHYPHHIVQRGHNRQAVFAEHADFDRYLATLREFKEEYGVKVYAFCLMTNHVHLLLAPEEPTSIGKLMKRLAGRQTRRRTKWDPVGRPLQVRPRAARGLPFCLLPLH